MLMGNPRHDFYKAREEVLRQRQRFVDATNAYNQAHAKKGDKGLVYYDESCRKGIYEQAKKRGFSAQELEKMEYYLAPEHWNQDEVFRSIDDQIIDATELFYKAEQFLNANTQKKSLGGRVFDAISSFGNHMDKEDDTNDN